MPQQGKGGRHRLTPVPALGCPDRALGTQTKALFEISEQERALTHGTDECQQPGGDARRVVHRVPLPHVGSRSRSMLASARDEARNARWPASVRRTCLRARPPRTGMGSEVQKVTYPFSARRANVAYTVPMDALRAARVSI